MGDFGSLLNGHDAPSFVGNKSPIWEKFHPSGGGRGNRIEHAGRKTFRCPNHGEFMVADSGFSVFEYANGHWWEVALRRPILAEKAPPENPHL
jgi:hypothetical protein